VKNRKTKRRNEHRQALPLTHLLIREEEEAEEVVKVEERDTTLTTRGYHNHTANTNNTRTRFGDSPTISYRTDVVSYVVVMS
jgi:hypothetical protein